VGGLGTGVPPEVLALVRSVPPWADADLAVTELHGGITNRNFRVDVGGEAFVIRVPGDSTDLLGIDRGGELEAAARAAALGIGPAVFGELPGAGTVITAFVPGVPADGAAFLVGDRLERLAGAVATFHASGRLRHEFPIFRIIEQHAADAVAHGSVLPTDFATITAAIARIEVVFACDGRAAVPCHNDLLPANVLFDGERGWLIDYEYAGMNEAMFDLANLSVNSGFDAAADDRLLAGYAQRPPTAPLRARLMLMKVVSELREGLWALVQQGISDLDGFDFAAYAGARLESCRAQLASPHVAAALEIAEATALTSDGEVAQGSLKTG
jgi:thiamine kinase-like enzyme